QPTWAKITQTVHGKGQHAQPKSPEQSTGRVSVLSPRTNVLICLLMDSHRRPVCADGQRRTHTDTYRQPRTPRDTNVLCVLNRQPTWAKITQTVHGKHQRAEFKDQRADMCTDGQPRTSSTDVLCVLTDTHGRPLCANGHPQTQPTWAKITQTFHGKGQRAESKDQCTDMCTDGQPRTFCTSCVCRRTPTDDLCVLNMQPTWAKITRVVHRKGQRAESEDQLHRKGQHAESKDQRADMCSDGQPQTSCVF
ncbi:unnamed protein product, partial [Brassica rapa]